MAKAIGVPKHFEAAPLTRVVSSRSDATERSASPGPHSPASSTNVVMKSPSLGPADSPDISDDDDSKEAGPAQSPKVRRRAGKTKGAVVNEVDPSKDPPWLAAIFESDKRKA